MSIDRGAQRRFRRRGRWLAAGTIAALIAGFAPLAGTAHAAGGIIISEVAPWGSGEGNYAADWFEVTNTTASAISVAGWKVDDSSHTAGSMLALNGITSIGPGESVIFLESTSPATVAAAFRSAWFGASPPAGLQIGTYSGSGVGLSTGGDEVNLYNAADALQAQVIFGASDASSPFSSFDNAAGLDNATISTLSAAGTNGAFTATNDDTIGSPGVITGSGGPGTTTTTTAPATTTTLPGQPWPGGAGLTTVDLAGLATENLSGLTYEGSGTATPGVLWAVLNNPGKLYRLVFDGTNWVPDTGDWAAGKTLRFPDGTGNPDAEGVTMVNGAPAVGMFVSVERNNDASGTSRNAILRFDPSTAGTTLSATQIWEVGSSFPSTGANLGLEAITWIPDSFLVSKGFVDEVTNAPYDPATYANHGTGLFFVGVEGTGQVHAFALNMAGTTFTKVATFTSGFPSVMAFEFDPETGDFWAHCDNGCANRSTVLRVSPTTGKFVVVHTYDKPGDMPLAMNTEGFAITPNSECVANLKPVYWSDDGDSGGFSLRRGTISCGIAPPAEVPEFPSAAIASGTGIALLAGLLVLVRRRRPDVI